MNWINRGTKVLQGNIDKGENMKKALAIFVTVCLLASLFVSCDNTTKLNELVSTRFDAAGSRSLIVSNENFIDFNDSSIKWQYLARKVSDPSYNVGAAAEWTDIPGRTPGLLSNTIEFSQGQWNFELRAVKTTDTSVVIYYGKTEAPVLLEKQTSTNPQSIVINLTAQLSGQKGFIVLSNVSVKHKSNGSVVYDAPSKVIIDDADTAKRKELVLNTDYVVSANGDSISSKTGTGYQISVGTHTVKVQKIGYNDAILAEEEKTIEVYAGLKTTISNWILEITQAGQFAPVAPTGTTSGDASSAVEGNLTLTVENVTPSMVKGNNTTVIVPVGILGSETANTTTATVSIAVSSSDTIDTSDENRFIVAEGMDAVAALDLTLIKKTEIKDTEGTIVSTTTEPVTEFGDGNEVTITTYVAKNLFDVKVRYNNGTDTPEEITPVSYDSSTGMIVFKVSHFSEYYVTAKLPEAKIGSTYYKTLNEAITKANKGDTVTINVLDDVTLDNGIANGVDNSRTITFIGTNRTQTVDVIINTVTAEGGQLNYQRGSSFTFENLTIKAGEGNFDGIVCDELTFKNCTITGKLTLFGKATFTNCVFDNTMANQYSIWTWGGTDVKFEGCTFNTNGKAILLYGGASSSNPTNLVVNNSTFNDRNSGSAGKAAIEIGNDYNATYTLTVNNATVNGFAPGLNTNSKVWANKNSMDSAHLTVTIDGNKMVIDVNSLKEAVENGTSNIILGGDIDVYESITINKSIILDANGHKITTHNGVRAFVVDDENASVSVCGNGSFIAENSSTGDNGAIFNVYDGCLTINGAKLESANTAIGVTGGTVDIRNAEIKAIDGGCSGFANGNNAVINVYGVHFTCESTDPDGPGCFWAQNGGKVNIYGGTFEANILSNVTEEGETSGANYCLYDYRDAEEYGYVRGTVSVYGGTFIDFNPADNYNGDSFIADNCVATKADGSNTWTVTAKAN